MLVLETEPGPAREQLLFLTAESSLQPARLMPWGITDLIARSYDFCPSETVVSSVHLLTKPVSVFPISLMGREGFPGSISWSLGCLYFLSPHPEGALQPCPLQQCPPTQQALTWGTVLPHGSCCCLTIRWAPPSSMTWFYNSEHFECSEALPVKGCLFCINKVKLNYFLRVLHQEVSLSSPPTSGLTLCSFRAYCKQGAFVGG